MKRGDYKYFSCYPLSFTLERSISYLMAGFGRLKAKEMGTIFVYHGITSNANKSDLRPDLVNIIDFELQMRFLRERSFNPIRLGELVECLRAGETIPKKTVVITFDDGYKNNVTNALPILQKYEIPATIFLASGYIGKNDSFPWLDSVDNNALPDDTLPMNWEEAEELQKAGMEIGSHTSYHKFLPYLEKNEIEGEILKSKELIEDNLSVSPISFALPFSYPVSHRAWPAFKKLLASTLDKNGFTSCCTMLRGHIPNNGDHFFLKRIPIGRFDDLEFFRIKLDGYYSWTRAPQYMYQKFFKKYTIV